MQRPIPVYETWRKIGEKQMSNDLDDLIFPLLIVFALLIFGFFLYGHNEGYKRGKNDSIVFCMEKQKECKIKYQFLKLEQAESNK